MFTWRAGLFLYFVEATVFSESSGLVGFTWGLAYGSVGFGRFTVSREVDSQGEGSTGML